MRALLAMLLVFLLAGCDSGTSPEDRLAGTYNLESINGDALPVELFGVTIHSGKVTLRSDETYVAESTQSFENPFTGAIETATDSETGTYALVGNVLRITSSDGDQSSAAVLGNTLTISTDLFVAVYRRQ